MGTVTITGRDELGRIIDVTFTTSTDAAPPGPEIVAPGGGDGTPMDYIAPETATPEQIVNGLIAANKMNPS